MGLADFSQVREIGMTACNDLRCLGQLLRWLICLLNHTSWERARLLNLARLCILKLSSSDILAKGCAESSLRNIYNGTRRQITACRMPETLSSVSFRIAALPIYSTF